MLRIKNGNVANLAMIAAYDQQLATIHGRSLSGWLSASVHKNQVNPYVIAICF